MKYIKYFESNDTFIKGDIVYLKNNQISQYDWLGKEPFEITYVTFGARYSTQYNKISSLIRDYTRNWTLNKDIIHLTEKEKENLKIKLNILKFNI